MSTQENRTEQFYSKKKCIWVELVPKIWRQNSGHKQCSNCVPNLIQSNWISHIIPSTVHCAQRRRRFNSVCVVSLFSSLFQWWLLTYSTLFTAYPETKITGRIGYSVWNICFVIPFTQVTTHSMSWLFLCAQHCSQHLSKYFSSAFVYSTHLLLTFLFEESLSVF